MDEDPRAPWLRKLVAYVIPIEPVLEALSSLPYDCPEDLVHVSPQDLVAIIDRWSQGELTPEQITDWADLLEMRDGVGFASPHADEVSESIFRLANPTLEGQVTPGVLQAIRSSLRALAG